MKRKLLGLLIAVLMLSIIFAGCNENSENKKSSNSNINIPNKLPSEFNESTYTYTNFTNGYTITINSNWSVAESTYTYGTVHLNRKNSTGDCYIQLDKATLTPPETFEDEVNLDIEFLPPAQEGFDLIFCNYTEFHGLRAHEIRYTCLGCYLSDEKNKILSFEYNNSAYYVKFFATPSNYDMYINEVDQIIDSFTFL